MNGNDSCELSSCFMNNLVVLLEDVTGVKVFFLNRWFMV